MKYHFEVEGDKIFLVLTTRIWGGDIVNRYDVTEEVTKAMDEALFKN